MTPVVIYGYTTIIFKIWARKLNFKMLKDLTYFIQSTGFLFGISWITIDPDGVMGIYPLWVSDLLYNIFYASIITTWILMLNYWRDIDEFLRKPNSIKAPGLFKPRKVPIAICTLFYCFLILVTYSSATAFQESLINYLYVIVNVTIFIIGVSYIAYSGCNVIVKMKKNIVNNTTQNFFRKSTKLIISLGFICLLYIITASFFTFYTVDGLELRQMKWYYLGYQAFQTTLLVAAGSSVVFILGEVSFFKLINCSNWPELKATNSNTSRPSSASLITKPGSRPSSRHNSESSPPKNIEVKMHQYKITKEFDISSKNLKLNPEDSARLSGFIQESEEPKLAAQISDLSDTSPDIPMATVEKISFDVEALKAENQNLPELSPNTNSN